MSSTKTKTLLVIAAVLFLGVAAGLVATWQFMRPRGTASDLQGFWEGSIEVQKTKLRLVVKVDRSPDGSYAATLDSIDQGAKDIPINTVSLSNATVRLQLASMQAGYEGKLNWRATEISGQWQQRGLSLPLILKRTTKPSTIAAPLPSAAYARRPDSPLQGVWKGTIKAGAIPLRVVFKISETAPGKFVGVMDSTDQGARNIPLTAVEFTEPDVHLEISAIDGLYSGTLKADASQIEGDWTQRGQKFRLLLTRADAAEDAAPDEGAYTFANDAELQGFWNGTLDAAGTKLRLVIKIAKSPDGFYSAAVDSPDQGAKDIPATAVTFNDPDVSVEWKALRALFHGKLENGRLAGFWQQGPSDFPLELERTNRAAGIGDPKAKN